MPPAYALEGLRHGCCGPVLQPVPVTNRFIARVRFTGLRTPSDSLRDAHYRSRKHKSPPISVGRTCTCMGYPGCLMRTRCHPLFPAPRAPRETHWPACFRWLPDGLPGRLSDSQIHVKHPSVIDRRSLSRKPAGATRRGTCGAYVLQPANQLRSYYWSYNQLAAPSASWQNPCR